MEEPRKITQKQGTSEVDKKASAMKHITLSADRPEATDPRKVLKDYGEPQENMMPRVFRVYIRCQQAKSYILEFIRAIERRGKHRNDVVGNKTPVIGSDEHIYASRDHGFLDTVLMAYNHHWNLRTSPEDWWFCVISRVARAIDENSKKESVRKLFVEHEAGKKPLTVFFPDETNIYDVDYTVFFDEIEKLISENVKVPEYVDCVTADFSTTTSVQRIVSQVTLMSSMQEFFEYILFTRCGIPAIEMLGTEEDWKKLLSKLEVLRTVLEPIREDLELGEGWWCHVQEVFSKLLDTYRGLPDEDWWSRIISKKGFGSGKPNKFFGWFVKFLQGSNGINEHEIKCGLVSTPLTLQNPSSTDQGALVAGMTGYTVHEATENKRISVQAFHGWALMISENSPFRLPERVEGDRIPRKMIKMK